MKTVTSDFKCFIPWASENEAIKLRISYSRIIIRNLLWVRQRSFEQIKGAGKQVFAMRGRIMGGGWVAKNFVMFYPQFTGRAQIDESTDSDTGRPQGGPYPKSYRKSYALRVLANTSHWNEGWRFPANADFREHCPSGAHRTLSYGLTMSCRHLIKPNRTAN
jgi:hypothetical protein